MTENESLKKSHSKLSNFKLTLLCLFAAIVFSALFIFLILFFLYKSNLYLILSIVTGALTLLSFLLFSFFKR